jgi:hypothetical protein
MLTLDVLDMFSAFYAVVLYHQVRSGLRVRWSPTHTAWVRSAAYSRYMPDPWLDIPGEVYGHVDAPTEEDRAAAISLAASVIRPERSPFLCQRCGLGESRNHFIAPDVNGDPELYCLQVPAYSVVGSSGGTGRLKHWGSPYGCHSVKYSIDSDAYARRSYIGPLAAYVFGAPLPADGVINREWCARCTGTAANVRSNSAGQGEDAIDWIREEVRKDVLRLSRSLAEYYGEA